ncbi:MAG TPA: type IV pili twitching motility protein PilT [Acidimicrobiaceae bacterium]|nr:type IV pili twitching motility protein PilT [Acidimicrobiaceae bacterium]
MSTATRTESARRLADALVSGGYASEDVVSPLVAEASTTGRSFADLLITRGGVAAEVVLGVQSQLTQLPVVDLHTHRPASYAMDVAPPAVVREFGAVGFELQGDQLVMAFNDPPDSEDLRTLSSLVGHPIIPVLADPRAVERLWQDQEPVSNPAEPAEPAQPAIAPDTVDVDLGNLGADVLSGTASSPDAPGANGASGASGGMVHANGSGESDEMPLHLDDLLRYAVGLGASDLHLTSAMPACIRLNGAIRPIEGSPVLDNEMIREMVFGVLPQGLRERFEAEKELDTSHSVQGVGRFRMNVFQQRGTVAAVLRAIPHEIPPFESLGVPESVRTFTELRRGLVLVTGPTGSGKSTTLASLVDIINRSKPLHIVTVEDPIEFLHNHKRSIVNQREVGQDTFSFAEALRRVLREDPDVILLGEMRDLETISMALTAAETGHLVFATLHTQDAPQTIDRIVDVFPTNQQEQVRTMLGAALEGVVTQQLIPNLDGTGRVAVCEVMMCTSAIRNLIRSNKTHQIYSLMQTGGQYGMQTMDQALARMVREQKISEAVAYDRSRSEEDLRNHLNS